MSRFAQRLQRVKQPSEWYSYAPPNTGPVLTGWPDATNTGWESTGVTLTPTGQTTGLQPGNTGWHWSGNDVVIDQSGAVLDGLDITGTILGQGTNGTHDDITIRRCRVRYTNNESWQTNVGGGALVEDCEFGGGADGTTYCGVVPFYSGKAPGSIFRRCYFHHIIHAIHPNGNTLIEDCYVNNVTMGDATTPNGFTNDHSNSFFVENGFDLTIRHCNLVCGNTSGVFGQDYDNSPPGIGKVLIEHTRMFPGNHNGQTASYGICFENKAINGPIVVRNNTFVRGMDSPLVLPESTATHPKDISHYGNFYTDSSSVDADTWYTTWVF